MIFSGRLLQAIEVGMIVVDEQSKTATTMAPPNVEKMTDEEWLLILKAAGEVERELKSLGYSVNQVAENPPNNPV